MVCFHSFGESGVLVAIGTIIMKANMFVLCANIQIIMMDISCVLIFFPASEKHTSVLLRFAVVRNAQIMLTGIVHSS